MEKDCANEPKCMNCQENHAAFTRSWYRYKKEEEILEITYKRNITFFEARRIVKSDVEANTYATVARWAKPIRNSNQPDNYRALVEKLT